MLNPSAAVGLPRNYPAQDYGRVFDHTRAAGVGVVAIRVLAGGALSGSAARHPVASPPPEPIGSAMSYDADVARARRLMPLVEEGFRDASAKYIVAPIFHSCPTLHHRCAKNFVSFVRSTVSLDRVSAKERRDAPTMLPCNASFIPSLSPSGLGA